MCQNVFTRAREKPCIVNEHLNNNANFNATTNAWGLVSHSVNRSQQLQRACTCFIFLGSVSVQSLCESIDILLSAGLADAELDAVLQQAVEAAEGQSLGVPCGCVLQKSFPSICTCRLTAMYVVLSSAVPH